MNDERLPALGIWRLTTQLARPCQCRFSMLDGVRFLERGT